MILIKRWENHINIHATFVDECMAVPYGMYDLILHLAECVLLFWIEQLTPWSSQVHPEAQPKCVQATEGC
jgi:hypothetical protein